jgi:predicted DNA-binding mobile mystery protein A
MSGKEQRMTNPKRSRIVRLRTRQQDDILKSARIPQRPRGGWVAAVREALGMTQTQLAKRMGIARPSLARLEANEVDYRITLGRLKAAAEALGCDLQYVLVPRISLAQMVSERALQIAAKRLGRINQSQALEASAIDPDSLSQAVYDLAKEIEMRRPKDLWND